MTMSLKYVTVALPTIDFYLNIRQPQFVFATVLYYFRSYGYFNNEMS